MLRPLIGEYHSGPSVTSLLASYLIHCQEKRLHFKSGGPHGPLRPRDRLQIVSSYCQ
jgi:hypothetical protein